MVFCTYERKCFTGEILLKTKQDAQCPRYREKMVTWFEMVSAGWFATNWYIHSGTVTSGWGGGGGQQTKEIFFQLFFIVCTHSFQKTQQKHQGNLIILYRMSKTKILQK